MSPYSLRSVTTKLVSKRTEADFQPQIDLMSTEINSTLTERWVEGAWGWVGRGGGSDVTSTRSTEVSTAGRDNTEKNCTSLSNSTMAYCQSLKPPATVDLLGGSSGVVNSPDVFPASLKSLGCFYFRCVLSSQRKAVTVNLRILLCQL